MSKSVLGLDLGSNSLGWALLQFDDESQTSTITDVGVRIFPKAVEEKTPTPKNQQRRTSRLARRVLQRRSRRKKKLLTFLVSLNLLPESLLKENCPEGILNSLGDPYQLRARALDHPLTAHELGRVLLHLVQRRGFLSNRKTLLGQDMLDDPDVLAILDAESECSENTDEETVFKAEIGKLRQDISDTGCRTLGEYLAAKTPHSCKRNRDGQHLRTDRQMYQEELALIFEQQARSHPTLTENVQAQIVHIIFYQRPLKLKQDRVGKCSLELGKKRAAVARLEYQQFRYLQDINHLEYLDPYTETSQPLHPEDKQKLADLFEVSETVTFAKVRKVLGLDKKTEFNLESGVKKLKGNTTAATIRAAYPGWDTLPEQHKCALVEDLLSFQKKSALKKRLMNHWGIEGGIAVQLCMVELEPEYGNLSLKAIRRLLPYLRDGMIYSEARTAAGYGYENEQTEIRDKLGSPPLLPNPIVNRGLHELKRIINALIQEYGKPDIIRIEMARDLEMNTKRYKAFIDRQKKNARANEEAVQAYQQMGKEHPKLKLSKYPGRHQKLRYRLWKDQGHCCAYSGRTINLATLFSPDIEIDHILPYSQSLDDSYMNKVVCFTGENRLKGQQTPIDAFGTNTEKWEQITQAISRWPKELASKRDRFYKRANDLLERDFISNQLVDTRYMAKEAGAYLATLGVDVTFTRGVMTDWLRHQWGLNELTGLSSDKERSDHRHHPIDAVVTACIDRPLYNTLVTQAKSLEHSRSKLSMKDIHIPSPVNNIKEKLAARLENVIVSHSPQRKITGALHESTGVGFIEGVGTVYRQRLDRDFKAKKIDSIVDETVRNLVNRHFEKYGRDPKVAFSEDNRVFHIDGITPIKRVRIVQSKTTLTKLEKSKFPVKNSEGKTFKWHAYGNTHHVEIFKHKIRQNSYHTNFVTAMEAAQRVRTKGDDRKPLIQTKQGEDWEFVMALHINDLVHVTTSGEQKIYRVQKISMDSSQLALRLHTAATVKNKNEGLLKTVNTLMKDYEMTPIKVNAIGKLLEP